MTYGIKPAGRGNPGNGQMLSIVVQHLDGFFQADNIQVLGKGHTGKIFKKPGKIRLGKPHKAAGIFKGNVTAFFFYFRQQTLIIFNGAAVF